MCVCAPFEKKNQKKFTVHPLRNKKCDFLILHLFAEFRTLWAEQYCIKTQVWFFPNHTPHSIPPQNNTKKVTRPENDDKTKSQTYLHRT